MGEIIDITDFKQSVNPSCASCRFTNREQTLGFLMCQNVSSPYADELVADDVLCPCFKRKAL